MQGAGDYAEGVELNDFLKETGKYLYDISKIVLIIGIVTPLIKDEDISLWPIAVAANLFIIGALMIYEGGTK